MLFFTQSHLHSQGCSFFFNTLQYSFNPTDSSFNIRNVHCDPCIYGVEGVDACICRKNCDNAYSACTQACIDNFTGLLALAECMEQCQLLDGYCISACGSLPSRQRNATAYRYVLQIWWNDGFIGNFDGDPQIEIFSDISSPPPNTLSVSLPDIDFLNKAHCFVFGIRIEYDDSTCCIFAISHCFDIG